MALISRKPSLVDTLVRSRKRQRVSESNENPRRKRSTAIAPDSLPWNEVALPDRLEDAEGFLGLEEVDGVEVVKDQESGTTAFRVGKASPGSSRAPKRCS